MIMEARQKRVGAVLALILVAALALVAYGLTSGAPTRKDCVEVTFASTLGGARIHACGARARTLCASAHADQGIGPQLRSACGRAGFPFATRD
jgi:hypothetical protein